MAMDSGVKLLIQHAGSNVSTVSGMVGQVLGVADIAVTTHSLAKNPNTTLK